MTLEVAEGGVHLDWATWSAIVDGKDRQAEDRLLAVDGLERALKPVRGAALAMVLDISAPGGLFGHWLWANRDALTILLHLAEDRYRVMCLPPSHLPASLARLVGMVPRSIGARAPVPWTPDDVEKWFAAEESVRRESLGRLAADRGWRLGVVADGRAPEQSLYWAGADGKAGPWLITAREEGLRAVPVSQTEVFRRFAQILAIYD